MSANVREALAELAPSVAFPVTICVLCYGAQSELARRFLSTLFRFTPPALFSLRAGLNEVEPATHRLFEEYAGRFGNVETFVEPRNVFKNPLMRRLFHERPLPTRWTLWCDDDTHFMRGDWLQRLALRIERSPRTAMWGMVHLLHRGDAGIGEWIRSAAWYRGLPLMSRTGLDGREQIEFRFAAGAFWALRTEVIRQLNWPDPRLIHANEDFLLGEALRQNQLTIEDFHHGVAINDAARRNSDAAEVLQLQPSPSK